MLPPHDLIHKTLSSNISIEYFAGQNIFNEESKAYVNTVLAWYTGGVENYQ